MLTSYIDKTYFESEAGGSETNIAPAFDFKSLP